MKIVTILIKLSFQILFNVLFFVIVDCADEYSETNDFSEKDEACRDLCGATHCSSFNTANRFHMIEIITTIMIIFIGVFVI